VLPSTDRNFDAAVVSVAAEASGRGAWVATSNGLAHITLSETTLAEKAVWYQSLVESHFDRHGACLSSV
jgi:hypothetical protein